MITSSEMLDRGLLQKALYLACFDAADDGCPKDHDIYECELCKSCEPYNDLKMDREKDASCLFNYYMNKALNNTEVKNNITGAKAFSNSDVYEPRHVDIGEYYKKVRFPWQPENMLELFTKGSRNKYEKEHKEILVTLYALCGSIRTVSDVCFVPDTTLRSWINKMKGEGVYSRFETIEGWSLQKRAKHLLKIFSPDQVSKLLKISPDALNKLTIS